jgi:hypothetical protein
VHLEIGEVRQPHDRRQVVGQAVVDLALVLARVHASRPDPVGPVAGALLLVEELTVDAVRIALERQVAAAQVRQQDGRDPRVVLDHLTLGETGRGIEDLVQVREREPAALDLDLHALGRRHSGDRTDGRGSATAPRG